MLGHAQLANAPLHELHSAALRALEALRLAIIAHLNCHSAHVLAQGLAVGANDLICVYHILLKFDSYVLAWKILLQICSKSLIIL